MNKFIHALNQISPMKYLSIFLCFGSFIQFAYSQDLSTAEVSKQIDQQVWEVFKEAYANSDAEKYNGIHTDDVLRITSGGIRQGSEYKDANTKWFSQSDRAKRTIDFRFEHRIHSDSIAYEIGYYKIVFAENKREVYGRFHVLLKKIDGTWKIAQDWDEDDLNGIKVSAADFERLE